MLRFLHGPLDGHTEVDLFPWTDEEVAWDGERYTGGVYASKVQSLLDEYVALHQLEQRL